METASENRHLLLLSIRLSILCSLIFVVNLGLASAPVTDTDFYYYSEGRKIELALSKEMIAVRFKRGITLEPKEAVVDSIENLGAFSERQESPDYKITLVPLTEGLFEETIIENVIILDSKPEVEFSSPVFQSGHTKLILMDEFTVKFKPSVTEVQIEALNTLNGVEVVRRPEGRNWKINSVSSK